MSDAPMAKWVGTLVAVTRTMRVSYTSPVVALLLGRCMADLNTEHDPSRHDGPPVEIRRRLLRVLAAMFAVLMGVAAIEGFWPGGASAGMALAFLALCAFLVPVLMAQLTRPIVRDVQRLEDDRARLLDLYGRARQDSLLDGLTGLGNHRAFQEELRRQLEHATRHKSPLSLLLVDVDDLKKVNDEHGHAMGDELLSAVGRISMSAIRRGDRAFRVGGDEFAVLLPNADLETGLTVARRMLAGALNGALRRAAPTIEPFSLSIGISAFPAPSTQGDLLYRHADAALYWCKRHGRTNAVAYDPGRHGVLPDERSIEDLSAALGTILAEKSLRPVYQPIFSMTTGRADRLRGPHPPDRRRARWPTPTACSPPRSAPTGRSSWTWPAWRSSRAGVNGLEPGMYLSVNLSPRTLESDQFHPVELTAIFGRRGIAPGAAGHRAHGARGGPGPAAAAAQRRRVPAGRDAPRGRRRRRRERRPAAPVSEIHFDIVKVDLSLVQGGILHDPSHGVLRALQELAARWSAHDRRRGRRDRRAARGHPRARHHRRPGLPARPARPRATRRARSTSTRSCPRARAGRRRRRGSPAA